MCSVESLNDFLLDSSPTRYFTPVAVRPVPNRLTLFRRPRRDACLHGALDHPVLLRCSKLLGGLNERCKCGVELVGVFRSQVDLVVGTLARNRSSGGCGRGMERRGMERRLSARLDLHTERGKKSCGRSRSQLNRVQSLAPYWS